MENLEKKIMAIAKEFPNGFTIELPSCKLVKSGGWVIASKETQNCFGKEGLKKVIEVAIKTTYLMGGWKNGKLFYFDAVMMTKDDNEARRLGIENEQIAIFNLDEGKEMFL